jgi:hypothetical protein
MPTKTVYLTKTCMVCGQVHRFELDAERAQLWAAGAYIQNVFPELSPEMRETMISGTCPPCFAALFPPEEEPAEDDAALDAWIRTWMPGAGD